jgi:hypothetical protein
MLMVRTRINYPFVPKSTAHLEPGQFWSIPLDNGRFGCGRVIQLCCKEGKRDTRAFLAGLLDWSGDEPPSSEAIAGRGTIDQGEVHIKTISENRGEVLGFRPLEADGIEPWLFLSQGGWGHSCWLQQGYEWLRPATLAEFQTHPVFSTWGYAVIKLLAEHHFGEPESSVLRPAAARGVEDGGNY